MKNTESKTNTTTQAPTTNHVTSNHFDLNTLKSVRPQKSMMRIKSLKPTRSNKFRARKVIINISK